MCVIVQRIGVYNQHAADQLELTESPVEYLRVSEGVRWCGQVLVNSHISKGVPFIIKI